jgi:hypothetical protein
VLHNASNLYASALKAEEIAMLLNKTQKNNVKLAAEVPPLSPGW